MYGDLIKIIYDWYYSIFMAGNAPYDFKTITNNIFRALTGEAGFFPRLYEVSGVSSAVGILNVNMCFISLILTYITLGILIVLLFRLFKWMFNLIFKLFRLN